MSAALLFDSVSRIARHEAKARPVAAAGEVTSLFANEAQPDHAVSVKLRETGLVLPRVPIAVGVMGFAAIPTVGDLVIVAFLDADYNSPVVVGRLYHPDQDPPKHKAKQMVLRLPSGASEPDLNLEIASDPVSIKITLPGDVKIEIKGETISLDAGETGMKIEAGGRLTAKSGGTSVTLKKDGDVTVSSQGKVKIEGSEVEIAGSGKVKITGGTVEIN